MTNAKAQMPNGEKESLAFRHLDFICPLDFDI
jgi:hypothetical protein